MTIHRKTGYYAEYFTNQGVKVAILAHKICMIILQLVTLLLIWLHHQQVNMPCSILIKTWSLPSFKAEILTLTLAPPSAYRPSIRGICKYIPRRVTRMLRLVPRPPIIIIDWSRPSARTSMDSCSTWASTTQMV